MKKKNKKKLIVIMSVAIIILVVFGPNLALHDPYLSNLSNAFQPPSWAFPFGTDNLGRCIFSRVVEGARLSIMSAVLVIICISIIGTLIGAMAAHFGGKVDRILMKLTVVTQAFPNFVLVVAFTGILGSGLKNAIIALILVSWTTYARLSRSLVLQIKDENYIKAAKVCGANNLQIIVRHILPNIVSMLIVTATLDVSNVILSIAGLSFLGLGSQPPTIEWGSMISSSRKFFQIAPWYVGFTALMLFVVVVMFNLIGDNLRDLWDDTQLKE